MNSPIKYFGGKNGFANKILEYFPKNHQTMNYIEPFCGSAAMLFHKERSPIEIINDIDENVYSIFSVLINKQDFSEFKYKCDLSLFSEKMLLQYKASLKNDDLSIVERAYKYYYCNRLSFNSSGGISASTSVRRNMSKSVSDYLSSIDKLYEIHNRLSNVVILNRDGVNVIKKYDKENTFMYCDSPYANETRSSGRYKHDFTDDKQDEYLNVLISIKNAKMLISGYNCERYEILEKNGYNRIDLIIKTQDSNQKGKTKIESLWFNY
jgi:DNA adenine methylase